MKQSRRAALDTGRCDVPRCTLDATLVFINRNVCERHWNQFMSEKYPDSSELRRRLGVKEATNARA